MNKLYFIIQKTVVVFKQCFNISSFGCTQWLVWLLKDILFCFVSVICFYQTITIQTFLHFQSLIILVFKIFRIVKDGNFGWRALRLLALQFSHFFNHNNNQITKLPEYLESMIRKIAKERPIVSIQFTFFYHFVVGL